MSIAVPFGQYVPVESFVHRLEPRAKMGLVLVFTLTVFSVSVWYGLAAAAALVGVAVASSRVPPRLAFRGLRAVSLILAFTLLAHGLRWQPATVSLVRIGPLAVDGPGLATGLFFATRIVLLVVGTSLLTLTTTPVGLTDALEKILRPLSRLGFPSGDVAMMLTVALRFIPTTAEEAERVILAQTARGARFDQGGPLTRARAYVPVLVPMFVALFRRADELATAMEARCYRGGAGRTRLIETRMTHVDWLVLVLGSCVMLLVAIGA